MIGHGYGANGAESAASGLLGRLFRRGSADRVLCEGVVIAVASGKGGTGKSFVATNLAVVLARSRRVTLVDCDFGLACDHLLLGLSPRATILHVVTGRASMREVRLTTRYGPSLVPGGSGVRHLAALGDGELQRLGDGIAEVAADSDVVILDVGAGITPQELAVLLGADEILIVTQPEIAAMTDAYALVKCLAALGTRAGLHVVVNRVTAPGQGRATFERIAAVSQRYVATALHHAGSLAEDPAVTQRRLGQPPLTVVDPGGTTSRAIEQVTHRLEELTGPLYRRPVDAMRGLRNRFRVPPASQS